MPEILEPGQLYVSLEHGAMVHLCACGCGQEVSLPLSPTDWKLSYDGENILLRPSVGNWRFPCRSDYVIEGGRVNWANDWSERRWRSAGGATSVGATRGSASRCRRMRRPTSLLRLRSWRPFRLSRANPSTRRRRVAGFLA